MKPFTKALQFQFQLLVLRYVLCYQSNTDNIPNQISDHSDHSETYDSVKNAATPYSNQDSFINSFNFHPNDQKNSTLTTASPPAPGPQYLVTETVLFPEECRMEHDSEINQFLLEQIMPYYNKQLLPNSTGGVQTRVEIHINAIPHFSELDSFFELDLFFSELWHEPRLAFGHLPQAKCVKNVTLGLEYLQRVWTPNVCIVNSKAALIHSSPSENVFLILYQDGMMWKNCRMLVRGPCAIDLHLFPFDVQTCSLVFESYSYNSQKVALRWIESAAIRLAKSIELPDFILTEYIANRSITSYPNGQWDQLKATFVFERRYGYFIMQAYLPTYMTVFVAWINFWMDPKELATRATLAISAFLAMCLQLGTISNSGPRVSYVKAMDVWMLGSISFLFVALIELAIISYMLRTDREDNGSDKKKRLIYIPPSPSLGTVYECEEPRVVLANQKGVGQKVKRGSLYHETSYGYPQNPCFHEQCFSVVRQPWVEKIDTEPLLSLRSNQGRGIGRQGRSQMCTRCCVHESYTNCYEPVISEQQRCSVHNVDRFFMIIYPPVYLLFNICYWTYYL